MGHSPESLHLTLVGQAAACPQDEVVGAVPGSVQPPGPGPGSAGHGVHLRQTVQ